MDHPALSRNICLLGYVAAVLPSRRMLFFVRDAVVFACVRSTVMLSWWIVHVVVLTDWGLVCHVSSSHLHHGKTMLMDLLIRQTHPRREWKTLGSMRYMDTRFDEQVRHCGCVSVCLLCLCLWLPISAPRLLLHHPTHPRMCIPHACWALFHFQQKSPRRYHILVFRVFLFA